MKRTTVTILWFVLAMSASLRGAEIVIGEQEIEIEGKYLLVPVDDN